MRAELIKFNQKVIEICFNVSISQFIEYIESRFGAKFAETGDFEPVYHASAFSKPSLPVIANESPDTIELYRWGLIPFWVKDERSVISSSTKSSREDS
jgi:putative SOS response-associated peptidase YedK